MHRDIANMAAEAGISINAFVKRALAEAVKHPRMESPALVTGYNAEQTEHTMLMEPQVLRYGNRDTLLLTLPHHDVAFAKDLAKRMGWGLQED